MHFFTQQRSVVGGGQSPDYVVVCGREGDGVGVRERERRARGEEWEDRGLPEEAAGSVYVIILL